MNENNRGLKLTPLGDRVRLAYTIYFGEVPGAALRRQLDRDGDGQVSEAEADRFGREVADGVRPALELVVDGTSVPIHWREVSVGMGTPEVRAGSFAVDLVAVACLARRGTHEVMIRDEYVVPRPGETELKVDLGLGVTLDHVRLGDSPVHGSEVRVRGIGGPLAEGWVVKFTVGDAAPTGGDDCAAAATGSGRWWIAAIAAAGALAIAAGLALLRRFRTARGTRTSRRSASS